MVADNHGLEGPSLVILVTEALITRREDPDDRRAKILSQTDAGRVRVLEIERIFERLRADLLAGEDELEIAVGLLARLAARLTEAEHGDG